VDHDRQVHRLGDGVQQVDQHLGIGLGVPGLGDVARADRREHEETVDTQLGGVPRDPYRPGRGHVDHAGEYRRPAVGLLQHRSDHPLAFVAVEGEQLTGLRIGDHRDTGVQGGRGEEVAEKGTVAGFVDLPVVVER
jgi:hypothetical protein